MYQLKCGLDTAEGGGSLLNSGPKAFKVGKVRTKCSLSGDRIWNKLGMKHRRKEKIVISNLRCINLGDLMHMLTSGNTCTHTYELT